MSINTVIIYADGTCIIGCVGNQSELHIIHVLMRTDIEFLNSVMLQTFC